MKKLICLALFFFVTSITYANSMANNESFSKAKKTLLKKVYYDHQLTFYCQNPYELESIKGRERAVIISDVLKYSPRNPKTSKGKINQRAKYIEWEHVMPAENFGRQLVCWREGDLKCVNSKGKKYKGRRCCTKVSKQYRLMQADMMNLVPAIGEVNGDRSNYRYADTNQSRVGQYGSCPFKVDFKGRKAYPAEYTKGQIGRIYLYMSEKYNLKLSKQQKKMMQSWSKKYKPSKWELTRAKRIENLQ